MKTTKMLLLGSASALFAAAAFHANLPLVSAGGEALSEDVKTAMAPVMQAFDAFKKSVDEQISEVKKGVNDPVLAERIGKIEKSMDAGIDARNAIDAAVKAEKKEREELEAKLNRMNLKGHSEESAKREVEIKSFNDHLASFNAAKNQAFTPLDGKSYDDYKAALVSYMRKGERGVTIEEEKMLQVGNDPDGGYFVTPDLSGRIVKKVYETSPVRQNANVQTISTDALEGIEDLGEAGAGYAGEHATSGDTTTPQVGKWRIPVFWIDTEPKTTQQLLDDAAVDIEGWLSGKVSDKFGRFENAEYVTGAANKIHGFVSGYTAASDSGSGVTWGTVGYFPSGASGDFASSNPGDALMDLVGILKNQYLANSKWFTRRAVITKIRKFKDGQGRYIWEPSFVAGTPEQIMGYPVVRMEDMPALGANSYSLAFGDLAQAYQIVDRQGIRVLRDNLTAKPYVKFYTTKRTGGGLVNFEAIKLMKFAAS